MLLWWGEETPCETSARGGARKPGSRSDPPRAGTPRLVGGSSTTPQDRPYDVPVRMQLSAVCGLFRCGSQ